MTGAAAPGALASPAAARGGQATVRPGDALREDAFPGVLAPCG